MRPSTQCHPKCPTRRADACTWCINVCLVVPLIPQHYGDRFANSPRHQLPSCVSKLSLRPTRWIVFSMFAECAPMVRGCLLTTLVFISRTGCCHRVAKPLKVQDSGERVMIGESPCHAVKHWLSFIFSLNATLYYSIYKSTLIRVIDLLKKSITSTLKSFKWHLFLLPY